MSEVKHTIVKQTLTNQVTAQLRRDVLLGAISSGSRITVQNISRRYNTSAIPVRETFYTLCSEGLLEINPYKGATVCNIDRAFVSNLYDILRSMEVLIIESIEGRWNDFIRKEIVAANEAIALISTQEEILRSYNALNRRFHDPLEQFCTNDRAIELRNQNYIYISILSEQGKPHSLRRVREAVNEHQAIIEALDSGDMHQVRKAYTLHSTAAKEELLRQIYG